METSIDTLWDVPSTNGVVPLYCQAWSMMIAAHSLTPFESGTVFQMGHWVSTKKPHARAAHFQGDEVSFVELIPGSIDMVECATYARTARSFRVGTKDVYGIAAVDGPFGSWSTPDANVWIPCASKAFRLRRETRPMAVVIHMRVSDARPYACEHFADGSNTIWSRNVTDLYVLSNTIEQRRAVRYPLPQVLRQFICPSIEAPEPDIAEEPMLDIIEETPDVEDQLVSRMAPLTLEEILYHATHI